MQITTVQHTPEQKEAAEFFESVIGDTSPLFSDAGDDFLTGNTTPGLGFDTSPWETPYDDFLTTPLFQDVGEPLISEQMDLFGGTDFGAFEFASAPDPVKAPLNVEALFTLSPTTPMLDSIDPAMSLYPSSRLPSDNSFAPSSSQRKPMGTRKNITPDTMVSLDAPTQPRQYRTPSATSRKDLPATFARKRTRTQAFGDDDDDDELEPEALGPNATEAEQIEFKRRQNTIAARKSRKRKLEYQQGLENKVEELKVQLEQWRVRAEIYAGVLRSHGLAAAALPPM
ncbi:hypothetical protein BDZ89DRAFT_1059239 [Hymenopellis radicata]|nr:hypothetical protein BDZ89DRAFT_1059239 [Hymenopellis radicata]